MKGRIKIGAEIYQDFSYGKWPDCKPPKSEYDGEDYQYTTKFPDRIFEVSWDESWNAWDCRADGYGSHTDYGNGSISVHRRESVEIIDET